jgi:hypothetical protein
MWSMKSDRELIVLSKTQPLEVIVSSSDRQRQFSERRSGSVGRSNAIRRKANEATPAP